MAPIEAPIQDPQYDPDQPTVEPTKRDDANQDHKQKDEAEKAPRETTYTVLAAANVSDPDFKVIGDFTVVGGQQAARKAAVAADAQLKAEVLNGEEPLIAAVANWNPVNAKVKAPAEPQIEV